MIFRAFCRMSNCVLRAPSRSALRRDLTSRRRATSIPISLGSTPVSREDWGISANGITPSESGTGRLTVVKQMLYSCVCGTHAMGGVREGGWRERVREVCYCLLMVRLLLLLAMLTCTMEG